MRFGHRFESRYYQKSTLSEDLIVAWPLDEASGTRYPDYGGAEFDLTDVNTVGTADAPPGIGGLCANFNGSNERLYCPDPFPPPAALSVSAWVYQNTAQTSGICVYGSSARLWVSGTILLYSLSADGAAYTHVNGGTIATGQWYLVTGVWNGAVGTAYKNGVAGTPLAFASSLYNSTDNLTLAALLTTNFWAGRIAQPLIWRRAITSAEISYLYNGGNGRPLSDWL